MAMHTEPLLRTADFDYPLPEERIAQHPLEPRDASCLLHIAADGEFHDCNFTELPQLLRPGDLLVANRTRVRAARLHGRRENGGSAEILVLAPTGGDSYECLVRPARRLRPGTRVNFTPALQAIVGEAAAGHPGARLVEFVTSGGGDVAATIEALGEAPLPPYIRAALSDPRRYQTIYARGEPESAAAPTAGLHFTQRVLSQLRERGIGWTTIDLTVGLGTFSPISADSVADHRMHREKFEVGETAAAAIKQARADGGRIVAVGTTVVRTLESVARTHGDVIPARGSTELFIRPGFKFAVVDGLLTNFHQPRSSLLVLLAAFVGQQRWRQIYDYALAQEYRFLSFGDCMLAWQLR